MSRIIGSVALTAITLLAAMQWLGAAAYAQETQTAQEKALNMIADFADRICKDVPIKGKKDKLELSGDAKAELRGMVKKFADLGLKGGAKYEQSGYEGVLQQDLLKALQDSANCKLKVFENLQGKLLPVLVKPAPRTANDPMTELSHRVRLLKSATTIDGITISDSYINDAISDCHKLERFNGMLREIQEIYLGVQLRYLLDDYKAKNLVTVVIDLEQKSDRPKSVTVNTVGIAKRAIIRMSELLTTKAKPDSGAFYGACQYWENNKAQGNVNSAVDGMRQLRQQVAVLLDGPWSAY